MDTDTKDKQVTPDADANDPYNQEFAALTNPAHLDKNGIPGEFGDGSRSGFYNPNGDNDAVNPQEIANQERSGTGVASTAASVGAGAAEAASLFTGGPAGPTGFLGKMLAKRITKKQGIIGGISGTIIGGALFFGLTSLGPLELIQISHTLMQSFSRSSEESSVRTNHLFRYARAARAGDIGEARVGIVGSKVFGNTIQQLNKSGIGFDRDQYTSRPTKLTVDQSKLSKSFPELDGMHPEQAKAFLADKLGVPVESITGTGGKFAVDMKGFDINSSRLLVNNSVRLLGDGSIATSLRARALTKFFDLPSLFHPFSRARAAATQTIVEKLTADKKKQGKSAAVAEAEAIAEAPKVEDLQNFEKTVTEPFAGKAAAETKAVDEAKNGFAGKLTGALTVTGFACIVKDTAGHIAKANQLIVTEPAGVEAISWMAGGQQSMALSDKGGITHSQVDAKMATVTDEAGKTFFSSKAFNYLANPNQTPTGADLPTHYKQAFSDKSGAKRIENDATNAINLALSPVTWIPGINADSLCSGPGMIIQAGVLIASSIASEIASGGLDTPAVVAAWGAKTVGSGVVSSVAISGMLKVVEKVAIDSKLPQKVFEGELGGSLLAYGARHASNISAISSGAISLGNDATTLLSPLLAQQERRDFQSQSLFARLFSTSDYNSLLGHVASSFYTSNFGAAVTNSAHGVLNMGSLVSGVFGSLIPRASALSQTQQYDWGFPQYGLPDTLLNDPSLADPYANADAVVSVLDSGGQNYISKARTCFGVNIQKNNGVWDVLPDSLVDTSSKDYANGGCNEQGDGGASVDTGTWRRLIMFVFDTRTMDAAACYQGDDDACGRIGIGSAVGTSSPASPSTTTPGTYNNPLRGLKNIQSWRIDGGVDYNADAGPIYAIGDGVVISAQTNNSGWPGLGTNTSGSYIQYRLTDGKAQGKTVYMAEDCYPRVKAGDKVTADTVICDYHYAGTGMETGWSDGSYNYLTNDYILHGGGSYASNSGLDFSKFMVSINGPPGRIEGTASTVPMPAGWPTW